MLGRLSHLQACGSFLFATRDTTDIGQITASYMQLCRPETLLLNDRANSQAAIRRSNDVKSIF